MSVSVSSGGRGVVGVAMGGEAGPSGTLEVFASGEAEEGSAVAAGVEHEKGVRGCVTRKREEDGTWAWAGCTGRKRGVA